jgi:hypothetical protein
MYSTAPLARESKRSTQRQLHEAHNLVTLKMLRIFVVKPLRVRILCLFLFEILIIKLRLPDPDAILN